MAISNEFQALILNELGMAWTNFSRQFGWKGMSLPVFRLHHELDNLGRWTNDSREMSFSTQMVMKRPWSEVLEVLKHEMAHQYVHEMLHVEGETAHGPTFRSVCKKHCIDAASRKDPDTNKISTTNHIVEKVQHLLVLASNPGASEAEARTAADTAHNMMLKYNIEVQAKNEERGYTTRYLGGLTGRIQKWMSELAALMSKYYFVEVIWLNTYDPRTHKKGHELEVSGTEENVEVVEFVHQFLSRAAVQAWNKKMASSDFKYQIEDEVLNASYGSPHSKKGCTISARSNFLHGFILGFKAQLKQMEVKEISQGLVLAKDPELEKFFHERYPSIVRIKRKGGHHNTGWRNEGFAEGNALQLPNATKTNKQFIPLLKG